MKFKNPATGEVYRNILVAMDSHCDDYLECHDCKMKEPVQEYRGMKNPCSKFCVDHPEEAARLMGYEVIEEEQEDRGDKPRICEILGVDVGEKFWYPGEGGPLVVTKEGYVIIAEERFQFKDEIALFTNTDKLIKHPEKIIRKPKLTPSEVEDIKALKRLLDVKFDTILCLLECNERIIFLQDNEFTKIKLNKDVFPSLAPGQSVRLV